MMSGKILTAIGIMWFACLALLLGVMWILSSRSGGVGVDIPLPLSTTKVVLALLLFGWIPVLAVGIYRIRRLY
jgi:hypothetical protein